ncbi:MAG: NHL repeat-containing protein [Chitinivibrionales bacterium]|nr:NHL repeat-containing protein [Chitinivibrionales bacterium]
MLKKYTINLLLVVVVLSGYRLNAESLVFPPYGHSKGIQKLSQVKLTLFLPFAHFDEPQGMACTKMISRDDTSTDKDDDELTVYGVNSGASQIIYNTSMWTLDAFGKKGSGKDQFRSPKGITCDQFGNVYVVDAGNNRIVHLFNEKKKVKWVKVIPGTNSITGRLKDPSQIDIDATSFIYVTDSGNKRIIVFDSFGEVVKIITGSELVPFIGGPTTLALADGKSVWSFFKDERFIFTADSGGKRLWKIQFNGKVDKIVKMPPTYSANYAAVDYYHNVWVTDKENHCIMKFDHELNLLDIFGSYGKDNNQFQEPRGITIWKRFGQVFIAEKTGAQYYWIGSDVKNYSAQVNKESIELSSKLTEYSFVSLFSAGSVGRQDTLFFIKQQFLAPGLSTLTIPLSSDITSEVFPLTMRVEPTYSSYSYKYWDYPVSATK